MVIALLLLLFPLLYLGPLFASGLPLYTLDRHLFCYQEFALRCLRAGELPLWNPFVHGGMPFWAATDIRTLLPRLGAEFLLPGLSIFQKLNFLHAFFLTLGAWGAYRLVRRTGGIRAAALMAGFSFGFGGHQIGRLFAGHFDIVYTAALVPFVFMWTLRALRKNRIRSWVPVGLCLGLMLYTGHVQLSLMTAGFLCIFVLAQLLKRDRAKTGHSVLGLFLAFGLFAGLGAAQWMPAMEFQKDSERAGGLSWDQAAARSLAPRELITLIQPWALGDQITTRYRGAGLWWERTAYAGVFLTILGLLALFFGPPAARLWCFMALGGLLLALGNHTPVYGFLYQYLPGFSVFREPGRFLLFWNLGIAVSGAVLCSRIFEQPEFYRRSKILPSMVLLVVVLDMHSFGSRYIQPAHPGIFKMPDSIVRALLQDEEPFRVLWQGQALTNLEMLAGIPLVNGYKPIATQRYAEFVNTLEGAPLDRPVSYLKYLRYPGHPLWQLLNLRYLIQSADVEPPDSEWEKVLNAESLALYRRIQTSPRAWLIPEARWVRDRREIWQRIAKPGFDPVQTLYLEGEGQWPASADWVQGEIEFLSESPHEMEMGVRASSPCWLVLSEPYDPAWRAGLDGSPVNVYPANGLIRAVRVPAGEHRVEFRYCSRSVFLGIAITLVTICLLLMLSFPRVRRVWGGAKDDS
ncbi:MAG: YfhO family protein [Candidatus Omnitrophica bacterium]|nr:YfhO family protein [Candidatus Omnitrophota bacterium]